MRLGVVSPVGTGGMPPTRMGWSENRTPHTHTCCIISKLPSLFWSTLDRVACCLGQEEQQIHVHKLTMKIVTNFSTTVGMYDGPYMECELSLASSEFSFSSLLV